MFSKTKINYLDFDIYSKRITFFYNNKEKIGSVFGFILAILYTIILIILFLIYFIMFLYLKYIYFPKFLFLVNSKRIRIIKRENV